MAFVFGSHLFAASEAHWNVAVGVAYSFPSDSHYEIVGTSASGTDQLNSGYGAYLGVGYGSTRYSVEVELLYFKNDAQEYESDSGGGAEFLAGDFTHVALVGSLRMYFWPKRKWKRVPRGTSLKPTPFFRKIKSRKNFCKIQTKTGPYVESNTGRNRSGETEARA